MLGTARWARSIAPSTTPTRTSRNGPRPPAGTAGPATQQFNESYTFSLENLSTVNATNSLGVNFSQAYGYNDPASKERVTSVVPTPAGAVADYYSYDRRGRGLITQHKLTTTQNPAQDSYEYDSQNRLISIAHLGSKVETLAYDGVGDLRSRIFTNGSDLARYYIGDDLTGVVRSSTTKIGYVHIRLGGQRIASFWVKTTGNTNSTGVLYYHRNHRGDVVATTTSGGQMGISYRYLPYGVLDATLGAEDDTNTSELGFIGGLKLSNGLIHLKARAYSPTLRRFLQPDTLDRRRYTYGACDPLNRIDPSGRNTTDDTDRTICGAGDNCTTIWVNPSEEALREAFRRENPDDIVGWWSTSSNPNQANDVLRAVWIPNPTFQDFADGFTTWAAMLNGFNGSAGNGVVSGSGIGIGQVSRRNSLSWSHISERTRNGYAALRSVFPLLPSAIGGAVTATFIMESLSGGGGQVGVNFECTVDTGCGVYWIIPEHDSSSQGFSLGVGAEVNAAWGSGSWGGPFTNVMANIGPFGGTGFFTAGVDPNLTSQTYVGGSFGGSVGALFGAAVTTTVAVAILGE